MGDNIPYDPSADCLLKMAKATKRQNAFVSHFIQRLGIEMLASGVGSKRYIALASERERLIILRDTGENIDIHQTALAFIFDE